MEKGELITKKAIIAENMIGLRMKVDPAVRKITNFITYVRENDDILNIIKNSRPDVIVLGENWINDPAKIVSMLDTLKEHKINAKLMATTKEVFGKLSRIAGKAASGFVLESNLTPAMA